MMLDADVVAVSPSSVSEKLYPEARPRVISDNGPRFIAREFKEFSRISGMTHVRTSPFCPQSNGNAAGYIRPNDMLAG